MKKRILLISILIVLFGGIVVYYVSNSGSGSEILSNSEDEQITDYNAISFMLETEEGSGVYEESTSSEWPTSGYTFNASLSGCENGGTLEWDSTNNQVVMTSATTDKCYIYFDVSNEVATLAEYVASLAESDTTNLATDDPDGNVRYIGADPDNYIDIGDSVLWRIIGTFEITTADGSTETLVKIIRSSSIGYYTWNDDGTNNWPDATLNTYLNETYLSSLDSTTQSYFESVVWKLGGASTAYPAPTMYTYERGTTVYSGNDTTWTGTLALMYPSDYGYATNGEGDYDRTSCLEEYLYSYDSGCYEYDWLYLGDYEWLLTAVSSDSYFAFFVASSGNVGYGLYIFVGRDGGAVRPVGYLVSSATIQDGDGTSESPYVIVAE